MVSSHLEGGVELAEKLPNPPLVEVVFELRWGLHGDKDVPDLLKFDPGILVCAEQFATEIKRYGFKVRKRQNQLHEIAGQGVLYRYYKEEKEPFPLVQIGPGIFASNMAAEYEWADFKKQTLNCVKALLRSYPKLKEFPFRPSYLELRYTNAFDSGHLAKKSTQEFCSSLIDFGFSIPMFLKQSGLVNELAGMRNVYSFPIKSRKSTFFDLDVASATKDDNQIIRQISKVRCTKPSGNVSRGVTQYVKQLDRWLENAHNVTSPFFQSFVSDELLQEFQKKAK